MNNMKIFELPKRVVTLYRAIRDMDRFVKSTAEDPRQRAVIRYIETFPKSMQVWVANRMCERIARGEGPFPPSPYKTKYVPGNDHEVTVVDLETWCD